ncbi:hypothetical protein ABIC89_005556 [Variovorax boronicumulans]|uniref:hypothetical protein n=1 Tax=Variovorax boronicumulans TaxID=436515 RepID=UPI0033936C50
MQGDWFRCFSQHVADKSGVFVYYGNRTSLPARVRAFIDVAIELLADNPAYVLSADELAAAQAAWRSSVNDRHAQAPKP